MEYSYSQCSSFIECPKLWYWRYIRKIEPLNEPEYYKAGRDAHKGIEKPNEAPNTIYGKIGVLAGKFFDQRMLLEKEVSKKILLDSSTDDIVVCVADGLTPTEIVEYKTTSRATPDFVHSQVMSLQNRLYGYVFQKSNLLLRIIKKHSLKQKKGESDSLFEERILEGYREKPEEWFLEISSVIEEPSKALIEMKQIIKLMKSCQMSGVFPVAAPYGCYKFSACSYLPLCSDFETNKILYKEKGAL